MSGLKPRDTSSAAQIAIGIPKPAAPSRKPPKQKAISSIWMRWSVEIAEMEERTVSKPPDRTEMRYSHTAMRTIQPMGHMPERKP